MLSLFTHEIKVFNRTLTPDSAGGDSVSYVESEKSWRIRVSTLNGEYLENTPGREYPSEIRIVGEVRTDIHEGDRIEYDGFSWEIMSCVLIHGVGSIPDYIRAKAIRVGRESD